jgi:carbon storage regulator CsrA
MLMLSRRVGEEIVIDKQIRVVVAAIKGGRVQLGICAPTTVHIRRHELRERQSVSRCPPASGLGGSPTILAEHVVPVQNATPSRGKGP